MKTIFAITAAAIALAACQPAQAATNDGFVGARVEATAGYNDITNSPDANDVVYGGALGFDLPVGDRVTIGVEANTSNVFEHERQIGAAARLGYAFSPVTLGYVTGGYNNYQDVFSRKLDGFSAGAGIEHKISSVTYVKAAYKYSDFQANTASHAVTAGIGLRF